MKRKRGEIGYQKDELLVETTALNLSYNRRFQLDHNTFIYEYAKNKSPEFIYDVNRLVEKLIQDGKYTEMHDLISLCEK